MVASFSDLYRVLREPVRERYDGVYRHLRWKCGCTASGLNAREMLVKLCLHHRRASFESRFARIR